MLPNSPRGLNRQACFPKCVSSNAAISSNRIGAYPDKVLGTMYETFRRGCNAFFRTCENFDQLFTGASRLGQPRVSPINRSATMPRC